MEFKKGLAVLMLTGLVAFTGCAGKEAVKPPGQEQNTEKPQAAYVNEIDITKRGLKSYNGDLLISPNGDKAVFSGNGAQMNYDSKLVMADLNTGELTKLADNTGFNHLTWTPDGKKVLFGYTGLYSVEIDKFNQVKKVNISADANYGSISPDGTRIAFTEPGKGLYVANLDGSDRKRLTESKEDWYPVWYPDGKSLFFFADLGKTLGDGAGQLQGPARISAEGGQKELLLPQEKGKFRRAKWIIPGEALYVQSGWDDGYYERIYDLKNKKVIDLGENMDDRRYSIAVDAKNGRLLRAGDGKVDVFDAAGKLVNSYPVADKNTSVFGFTFSPDGKKTAYLSRAAQTGLQGPGGTKVVVSDSDGKNARELAKGQSVYESPVFTPDGKAVVFAETAAPDTADSVIKLKIVRVE